MKKNQVVWPEPIIEKLRSFRGEHFTSEETYNFIAKLVMEVEDLLLNPVIGLTYVEEFGEFQGFSRAIIRKFRIYYQTIENQLVVIAILFPGER
ncbi:hypothetical protein NLX71_19870 [Paenibacillus sp. MZ04-78.2]|uniref:hypothetical protein n=1 Tax=Paenibacillus sp. MZ04-78.2 TaxID=2962034 RepID=UPI0020B76FB4|nr:hypothetical protein [Paenibacillus sp. MZ04-78.2]MCP3775533.1 hypothetical protein [Paenibacillus sp. MZ04-78.2]